ncbi:hypothetical protein [Streptomyces mutabilis]|nr:hypothetical protein [Streptomyces mutabilis]
MPVPVRDRLIVGSEAVAVLLGRLDRWGRTLREGPAARPYDG